MFLLNHVTVELRQRRVGATRTKGVLLCMRAYMDLWNALKAAEEAWGDATEIVYSYNPPDGDLRSNAFYALVDASIDRRNEFITQRDTVFKAYDYLTAVRGLPAGILPSPYRLGPSLNPHRLFLAPQMGGAPLPTHLAAHPPWEQAGN